MGELRKDYVLDRFVIIATERAKRPHEFSQKEEPKEEKACFFCPGSEHTTPKEIHRWPSDGEWKIRVFPNKFAAVHPLGNPQIKTDNDFFTFSDSYGNHEVLVGTPDHNKSIWDLELGHIAQIFKIFNLRIEENLKDQNIKYVSVFKNHGKNAGTSIQHTHCQIISNNFVPQMIQEKEAKMRLHKDCPYCLVIRIEKGSDRRCFENGSFVSFTPYASRFPLEAWILPKRHVKKLDELKEEEFLDLAELLKKHLLKLKEINANYNFYIQYGIENMHLHIEIAPRLATWAGYELATGTIINTMTPEHAAEFYRS